MNLLQRHETSPILPTSLGPISGARGRGWIPRVAAATPPLQGAPPAATIAPWAGVQAIAALALGTETVKAVDMLVGPGDASVAEAKRLLF